MCMMRRVLVVAALCVTLAACQSSGSPHVDPPHTTTTTPALSPPRATITAAQLPGRVRAVYVANVHAEKTHALGYYTPRSDAVFGIYHVRSGVVYVDSTHGGYALSNSCAAKREWVDATHRSKAHGCLS
jgi:hypothetical protein